MGVPRIIRRVEAAKKDEKRSKVSAGITKAPKKKRADKLRALAGAFNAEAVQERQDGAVPLTGLEAKYAVHEKIGTGKQNVVVYRCTEHRTGQAFAVKRVPNVQLGSTHANEQPIFAALQGSTQLIAIREVIQSTHSVDYVMELADGGDLFEWILTHGALPEESARGVFAGLLQGLQQVQQAGFVHRDVKLENILLMHPYPSTAADVRLADFEFCTMEPALGAVGSVAYAAPETLPAGDTPYTQAVDVWAAGVALYAMLSASAPFDSPEDPALTMQRILAVTPAGLPFGEDIWASVSPAAKDLINSMLHPDPAARLPLTAVLQHPWLSGHTSMPMATPAATKRPKFALRCTWNTKAKRWSHGKSTPESGPTGDTDMSMMDEDDDASPFVTCPAEWDPLLTMSQSY